MWKRYRRRTLANPYFPKHVRRRPYKRVIIGCLLLVVLLAGALFYSPLLRASTIEIHGLTTVSEDAVRQVIENQIHRWSRLPFLRTDAIASTLTEQFSFEAVSIRKKFPHTLTVAITERTPYALWQTAERRFIIDQTGTIMREAEAAGEVDLPVFVNEANELPEGNAVLSSSTIIALRRVFETLQAVHGLTIPTVTFPSERSTWVKCRTNEGWELYIDLQGELGGQLSKLTATLEQVGERREALEYIDVRFADRVYYK